MSRSPPQAASTAPLWHHHLRAHPDSSGRGPGWEAPENAHPRQHHPARLHAGKEKEKQMEKESVSHVHAEHRHRKEAKKLARAVVHDIAACIGEFVGTFLFLFMAFQGAQSANFTDSQNVADAAAITSTNNQTILFVALSFGMSLIVTVWVFFRITGGAFNPAVAFSLYLIGNITFRRFIGTTVAQILGGIAASAVAKALTLGAFAVETSVLNGLGNGQALAIEMFTTALLCFTVLMLAAEKSKSTFLAPVAIGLSVFVGHLASVGWTGAGMNPARSFGPAVVNGNFNSNAWIYYVGQYLGALVACIIYMILKAIDYTDIVGDVETADVDESANLDNAPLANVWDASKNAVGKGSMDTAVDKRKDTADEAV